MKNETSKFIDFTSMKRNQSIINIAKYLSSYLSSIYFLFLIHIILSHLSSRFQKSIDYKSFNFIEITFPYVFWGEEGGKRGGIQRTEKSKEKREKRKEVDRLIFGLFVLFRPGWMEENREGRRGREEERSR